MAPLTSSQAIPWPNYQYRYREGLTPDRRTITVAVQVAIVAVLLAMCTSSTDVATDVAPVAGPWAFDWIGIIIVPKIINGPVSLKGRVFPFSQAVVANGFVFVSGQLALGPQGEMVGETIGEQTEQVIANIGAVLKHAGASLADVVKTTIWITRKEDFAAFNEVYAQHFMRTTPARATVCSDLMIPGALVEIEAIAVVPEENANARADV